MENDVISVVDISIHAPSRERLDKTAGVALAVGFQSTLPRGSDFSRACSFHLRFNFNPRSLAGATVYRDS